MLAQLESDFDDSQPEQAAERLQVEEAIQRTEQAVASKDHQINELRKQLELIQQAPAEPAATPAEEAIDQDEVVQQERENLKRIQVEWQERLREAEVTISVERAKLARDRTELEEKVQHLERQVAQQFGSEDSDTGSNKKKPTRGKWLSRLGLSNDE